MWTFVLVVIGIALLLRSRRLKRLAEEQATQAAADTRDALESLIRRLNALERRVDSLETSAAVRAQGVAPAPAEAVPPGQAAVEVGPETAAEAVEVPGPLEAEPVTARRRLAEVLGIEPAREEVAPPPEVEERVSEFTLRRREIEQRLMENWTGILGSAVVVAGVTFIGIYTALRLEPFYRFLLTLAAGGALAGAAWLLGRKEQWRAFAAWPRSTGAAIVLFACAAAGGLPGLGLQWLHDPLPALGLLLAGIAANLYLAFAVGTQAIATLHVVLSLLPLTIVPPTPASIAIASAVTTFGVALAARGRWDRHLAVVLVAYLVFHVGWIARQSAWTELGGMGYFAAACSALVFVAAALVHYRRDYAQASAPPLQLAVHVANWALLALAMFIYVPDPPARGALLLVFGALAYRLARRGLALAVPWLYRTDTLTAQVLVLLALPSGLDVGATLPLLLLVALVETLAFRRLLARGQDEVVDKVADLLPVAAAGVLIVSGVDEIGLQREPGVTLAAIMAAGCVCAIAGTRWLRRGSGDGAAATESAKSDQERLNPAEYMLAVAAGPLLVVALWAVVQRPWMEVAALVAVPALMVAWKHLGRPGLLPAVTIALAGAHVLSWDHLVIHRDWAPADLSMRIAPLAALGACAIWLSGKDWLRVVAIALLGATVGLAAFLYFDPVSPLIPGVTWLILSLAALEIANRLESRESVAVLGIGYAYLAAFVAAYCLVILQTPAYVGTVRVRALIELFAIGVLAYWWFFHPRAALAEAGPWTSVHPLFLEMILVGAAVTVVAEVQPVWWAVAWAVIALALVTPVAERLLDARSRIYSLVFYWVSVADMAVVMSTMEVPSHDWYERPEFTSLVAIALQVAYVALSHRRLVLEGIETPAPMGVLGRIAQVAATKRNLYVYYPLFVGVAVFLYWRFDRSLLTLLWAAEAFIVFGLSAWLRENQFRYLALGGLAACLARLVLIDLAEANLIVRGLVFIGVGLLMLGMNAIYNRYRARFQS